MRYNPGIAQVDENGGAFTVTASQFFSNRFVLIAASPMRDDCLEDYTEYINEQL